MAMTTYKELSTLAAEVERGGDLNYAGSLWDKAAEVARKKANKEWATNRSYFCHHWSRFKKQKSQSVTQ